VNLEAVYAVFPMLKESTTSRQRYRAVDDLRSDVSRAIDLAWKRHHNGIGRFHPELEATTGAAKFKLRHYLCSRAL